MMAIIQTTTTVVNSGNNICPPEPPCGGYGNGFHGRRSRNAAFAQGLEYGLALEGALNANGGAGGCGAFGTNPWSGGFGSGNCGAFGGNPWSGSFGAGNYQGCGLNPYGSTGFGSYGGFGGLGGGNPISNFLGGFILGNLANMFQNTFSGIGNLFGGNNCAGGGCGFGF